MNFAKIAMMFFGGVIMMAVAACFTGTILWLLWPVTAVGVFNAPEMSWVQSVVGCWTLGIIASAFKVDVSVKENKNV